jgi:hypothetical protein
VRISGEMLLSPQFSLNQRFQFLKRSSGIEHAVHALCNLTIQRYIWLFRNDLGRRQNNFLISTDGTNAEYRMIMGTWVLSYLWNPGHVIGNTSLLYWIQTYSDSVPWRPPLIFKTKFIIPSVVFNPYSTLSLCIP